MYKPKFFKLYELLPPEIYRSEDKHWELLDERLLETLDVIREILGVPLICNTWYQGGNRRYCGFRVANCKVGAVNSYHKRGMAADLLSNKLTAEEMRQIIDKHQDRLPYPVRIERSVSWLHIDVAEIDYNGKKIYYFNG